MISKTKLTFLGLLINADNIRADPEKTKAIINMIPRAPTSVSDLRRFLEIVNQLGKFTPNLAQTHSHLMDCCQNHATGVGNPHNQKYLI